jgi:hypothetical protein
MMSLYNMLHGVNPCAFFLIPMLGEKHPDEYPRFRDCFTHDDSRPDLTGDLIFVYTRVGGGNRGGDFGEEELEQHPNFVTTYDDDYDNTYGMYVFSVPDEWKDDYAKFKTGDLTSASPAFQERVRKVFPKLAEKLADLWPATVAT